MSLLSRCDTRVEGGQHRGLTAQPGPELRCPAPTMAAALALSVGPPHSQWPQNSCVEAGPQVSLLLKTPRSFLMLGPRQPLEFCSNAGTPSMCQAGEGGPFPLIKNNIQHL